MVLIPVDPNITDTVAKIFYFTHTLYLFTANDLATFAIPTTLFALCATLSGSPLTANPLPNLYATLLRIPQTLLLTWANLLLFNIANQRHPISIEEDRLNKPHRPLPSNRITSTAARRILLIAVPFVLLLSHFLGVSHESLLLVVFDWLYNDLGGGDENWVLRNLLIAIGYSLYSSAALRIMAGPSHTLTTKGFEWVCAIALIMFVTQHVCDIKDAEGDRLRGRKTAVVELGQECGRWSVAVGVFMCSVGCPWFFELGVASYAVVLGVGGILAVRVVGWRGLREDKVTWKIWASWTCLLFTLPLVASPGAVARSWMDLKTFLCAGDECSVALNLAAVSGVALVVEGRRLFTQALVPNGTVPEIVIEGVIG